MSRKVPFECTDEGFVEEMRRGNGGAMIVAISPTCQLDRLCHKSTPSCKLANDPLLLDFIASQLASAKVSTYPVVRDEHGVIRRGRIPKREHQQMEI